MSTRQTFKTVDVVRLEVERTPTSGEMVNLVQNPRGELGAWGWLTPANGSVMRGVDWGGSTDDTRFSLEYRNATTGDVPSYFTSEDLPVVAGRYVAARLRRSSSSPGHAFRMRWEFYNAAGALISSGPQSEAYPTTSLAAPVYLAARVVPAGAVNARWRIDFYRDTGANPQPNRFMGFAWAMAVQTTAPIDLTTITANIPPAYYTDVLGPSHSITVDRSELNVGILTAEIRDAALDPAQGELIRPGRRVRLMVREGGTGDVWKPLFTGKVNHGRTRYDPKRTDAKRAQVTLTAIDNVSRAAQVPVRQGVATIAQLPYLLEGAGIPWNVNGSGDQVRTTPPIVSVNDSAKLIDQVAITRDSVLGYAWVDAAGVLQVWDRATVDGTNAATLDQSVYTDIDVDYDTDRCINTVTIKLLRPNLATGQTVEVAYGPFVDQASVDKWGPHQAEFTVHGIADTEAAAAAYANQVLLANATPQVRINSLRFPIASPGDISAGRALLDLYDLVTASSPEVSSLVRILGVKHTITPEKWLVDLGLAGNGGVASPQSVPNAPGGVVAADASTSANAGDVVLVQEGLSNIAANTWYHLTGMSPYVPAKGDSVTYAAGVMTIKKSGWYHIGLQCTFNSVARAIARIVVGTNPDLNVLVWTDLGGTGGSYPANQGDMVMPLNAGDQLRMYVYASSATATDNKRFYVRALGPL